MDEHILGVLEMDPVGVGAVAGGRDGHVVDQDPDTIVKFEVALGTVLNCDARDCHIETSIKPQSLFPTETEQ